MNVAAASDSHLAYCNEILQLVSRSFAILIKQLTHEVRDAVCVFYVILRALDTVEDDMAVSIDAKIPVLREFYLHLEDPSWKFVCGQKKHERDLMEKFEHVSRAYLQLSQGYREVISDVTKKMGAGMAEFITRDVETVADYDKYCYYVAGLVGIGLTRLFNKSGLENLEEDADGDNPESESLPVSMARFLQKTNIIRDYLEDINEIPAPRMFWPREIWGNHAHVLADFKKAENERVAVNCLNEMITDCLRHVPDCLEYMSALRERSIFRFCAIAQVMAIATMEKCYNNPKVFQGKVKVDHGVTILIGATTNTMDDVCQQFVKYTTTLASRANQDDLVLQRRVQDIFNACRHYRTTNRRGDFMKGLWFIFISVLLIVLSFYLARSKIFN